MAYIVQNLTIDVALLQVLQASRALNGSFEGVAIAQIITQLHILHSLEGQLATEVAVPAL